MTAHPRCSTIGDIGPAVYGCQHVEDPDYAQGFPIHVGIVVPAPTLGFPAHSCQPAQLRRCRTRSVDDRPGVVQRVRGDLDGVSERLTGPNRIDLPGGSRLTTCRGRVSKTDTNLMDFPGRTVDVDIPGEACISAGAIAACFSCASTVPDGRSAAERSSRDRSTSLRGRG